MSPCGSDRTTPLSRRGRALSRHVTRNRNRGPGWLQHLVRHYPPGTQIALACTSSVPGGRSSGVGAVVKNASPL